MANSKLSKKMTLRQFDHGHRAFTRTRVLRQQCRHLVAIVTLGLSVLGCARWEPVEIPEPSPATLRIISLTPPAGSQITPETTISVELEYRVERFAPKRFKAGATAAQTQPGYSWSLGPIGGEASQILPAAVGRHKVSYSAKALWEKPDLVRPFEITFSVEQLVGSWGVSVTAAKTAPVVFKTQLAELSIIGETRWQFPVTIEALQDVSARVEETGGQKRGVLYVGLGQSFIVKKGQRFLMLKVNQEGGCRIEFEKKQYEVSSCQWLDGFRDHQQDVFRVVSGR